MCVCVCVCVCVFVCVLVYVCICLHVCVCVCVFSYSTDFETTDVISDRHVGTWEMKSNNHLLFQKKGRVTYALQWN